MGGSELSEGRLFSPQSTTSAQKMSVTPRHTKARRVCRLRGASFCAAGITTTSSHPTSSPNVFVTSAPLAGCDTFSITAFAAQSPFGPSLSTASVDVFSVSMTSISISASFLITISSTIAVSSTITVSSTIEESSWFVVFFSITVSSTNVEENAIEKETDIDNVKEIVEESPTPVVVVDNIETEKTSTETVDVDGPKGDCAAKAVMEKVSQPAKSAEVRNTEIVAIFNKYFM